MKPARKSGEDSSLLADKNDQLELSSESRAQSSNSASIPRVRETSQPGDRTGRGRRGAGVARLREAARKVQTIQTVTGTFSNSQQVRDAAYEEWLARKSHTIKTSQRQLNEERKKRETDLKLKAAIRAERGKKTLQEWNKHKSLELSEKQKQSMQQAKEKQLQDESKREGKRVECTAVYDQWRKKKTELLVKEHRTRKREEERAREERETEEKDRVETSRKVLEIWNQRKCGEGTRGEEKEERGRDG